MCVLKFHINFDNKTVFYSNETAQSKVDTYAIYHFIVQELCESRGGRPGLSVLTSLLVSVDVKIY